jgi:hypothetical protein
MPALDKRSRPPSGLEFRAYHEAGHAVAVLLKGFSRPITWAAVGGLARSLLAARTLSGEHAVVSIARAVATAGTRVRPRNRGSSGVRAPRSSGSARSAHAVTPAVGG